MDIDKLDEMKRQLEELKCEREDLITKIAEKKASQSVTDEAVRDIIKHLKVFISTNEFLSSEDWVQSLITPAEAKIIIQALRQMQPVEPWISVEDRLPDSGIHVLLCCKTSYEPKYYICDGFYAVTKTVECSNNYDDDAEYDDETDEYYLPEGFYEVIKNWDEYSSIVIGDKITHWMPLPIPPSCGRALKGEPK